jgi:hypothetical protein
MLKQNTLISYTLFLLIIFSFSTLSAQLTVSPTSSVTDGTDYPALGDTWYITTVVIGEKTYALVASLRDNGVQIIDISDPATPSAVASVTDGRQTILHWMAHGASPRW